jgi:hypothetical protein
MSDLPVCGADIYRNLHPAHKGCVSIREHGKVTGYARNVVMLNVEFRVRPAGVQRIRRTGQREVVAYARGDIAELSDTEVPAIPDGAVRVCFNPHRDETFVLETGAPVHAADMLIMHSPCGSWVVNPR